MILYLQWTWQPVTHFKENYTGHETCFAVSFLYHHTCDGERGEHHSSLMSFPSEIGVITLGSISENGGVLHTSKCGNSIGCPWKRNSELWCPSVGKALRGAAGPWGVLRFCSITEWEEGIHMESPGWATAQRWEGTRCGDPQPSPASHLPLHLPLWFLLSGSEGASAPSSAQGSWGERWQGGFLWW